MLLSESSAVNWLEWVSRPPLELSDAMAEELITYAEGRPLDKETEADLDRWLFEFTDRESEEEYIEAADDLEALMRRNKWVAMLVAERTEEKRWHKRICAYIHDRIYNGDECREIEAVITSDPRLIELVERLQDLKPHLEAAFRCLEDEPLSLDLLPLIRSDCAIGSLLTKTNRSR